MARVTYRGEPVELAPGESVLDGLERSGHPVRSSCRSGACQSCVLKASSGTIPSRAQQGLREGWKREGYFLSCQWTPTADVDVFDADDAQHAIEATITAICPANDVVHRVWLEPDAPGLRYHAGQFVHVERIEDGVARAYSLASVEGADPQLELHVRRIAGGALSPWLTDPRHVGRRVRLRGPLGTCTYDETSPLDGLLVLAGTSTGLAPLWGIVRDALRRGHRGPVHLYAGSADATGLYLRRELAELAASYPNLTIHACVLGGDAPVGVRVVDLGDAILGDHPNVIGARAFLCGAPAWVTALKKRLFLEGMPLKAIASDAFAPASAGRGALDVDTSQAGRRTVE